MSRNRQNGCADLHKKNRCIAAPVFICRITVVYPLRCIPVTHTFDCGAQKYGLIVLLANNFFNDLTGCAYGCIL